MIINHHPLFDSALARSFLQAFEHSAFSMVITDAVPGKEQFLYANQPFLKMTGFTEQELLGKSPRVLQGEKTDRRLLSNLKESIYQGQTFIGQTINYRKDGSEYVARWSINPLKDDTNQIVAFVSCQMEVSQQVEDHHLNKVLSEALNQTADAAMITDLQGNILFSNHSLSLLTGYDASELLGKNTRIFQSGEMSSSFYQTLWECLSKDLPFDGVFLNRHKDRHLYFEHKTITPILDENHQAMYYLAISRDATEFVQQTDKLTQQAFHDELTHLFNRNKLKERLPVWFEAFNQKAQVFSLVIADIDDFKAINDEFGHDVGDWVLKQVASVLMTSVRQQDLVTRWGGEEFCLLVAADLPQALKITEKLKQQIAKLEFSEAFHRPVTLSFGVSTIRQGESFESLFKRADQGLYQAKSSGKNCIRAVESTVATTDKKVNSKNQ